MDLYRFLYEVEDGIRHQASCHNMDRSDIGYYLRQVSVVSDDRIEVRFAPKKRKSRKGEVKFVEEVIVVSVKKEMRKHDPLYLTSTEVAHRSKNCPHLKRAKKIWEIFVPANSDIIPCETCFKESDHE